MINRQDDGDALVSKSQFAIPNGAEEGPSMTWRERQVKEIAYKLWQAEGSKHGNDWAHWFQAEANVPHPLRVTFDTNVLDLACRPQRFPKDPRQPEMQRVHSALIDRQIIGFYSATMLTIEGIMRQDRADVYGGTRVASQPEVVGAIAAEDLPDEIRRETGSGEVETISVELRVEQSDRKPLHREVVARMMAAKALGLRILKDIPRIGAFQFEDPTGEYYESVGSGPQLAEWIGRAHKAARAIEARGVGMAQVKEIGKKLNSSSPTPWYQALKNASDVHQKRAIERAFGEWADGDSIASHIAYGIDIFCSADVGNSNATNSILDAENRQWLTQTFGVRFMTFEELAKGLG